MVAFFSARVSCARLRPSRPLPAPRRQASRHGSSFSRRLSVLAETPNQAAASATVPCSAANSSSSTRSMTRRRPSRWGVRPLPG